MKSGLLSDSTPLPVVDSAISHMYYTSRQQFCYTKPERHGQFQEREQKTTTGMHNFLSKKNLRKMILIVTNKKTNGTTLHTIKCKRFTAIIKGK